MVLGEFYHKIAAATAHGAGKPDTRKVLINLRVYIVKNNEIYLRMQTISVITHSKCY